MNRLARRCGARFEKIRLHFRFHSPSLERIQF